VSIIQFPSSEVQALNDLFASRKVLARTPTTSDLWRQLSVEAEACWQHLVDVCGSREAAEAAVARVARSVG
jgi:hypothetical protein